MTPTVTEEETPVPAPKPLYKRPRLVAAAAALLVCLAVGGGFYYSYASARVSTDDAFIEGRIVRVSAQVPGRIAKIYVTDNQRVQKDQLLAEIDPRQAGAAAAQAVAEALAAETEAARAKADARRAQELFTRGLIARAELDRLVADARAREAQAEAARKKAAQEQLDLSFTKVTAPEAGRVTRRAVEEGAYVQVGQLLMTIVPEDYWIVANFKETQLNRIRPGEPVDIKVDAYPKLVLHGHVDSIQSGTGSRFSLLPPENATGNFVKVVQRVPVKIVLDAPPPSEYQLGPGMSVTATVRVK